MNTVSLYLIVLLSTAPMLATSPEETSDQTTRRIAQDNARRSQIESTLVNQILRDVIAANADLRRLQAAQANTRARLNNLIHALNQTGPTLNHD